MKMLHFYEKFRKQAEKLEECKKMLKAYEVKGEIPEQSISDFNLSSDAQIKKKKKINARKRKLKKL
jgi:hypothetical protein